MSSKTKGNKMDVWWKVINKRKEDGGLKREMAQG